MDELKLLVEMVANLPSMALWVIAFFFAYKVICVGSLYGVIRFTVEKTHSWLVTRKTATKDVEIRPLLDGMTISSALEPLVGQLHGLRGKGLNIRSEYMHGSSVQWLREAIDEKEARERETKSA